jgi:uncharacterized membrane protein
VHAADTIDNSSPQSAACSALNGTNGSGGCAAAAGTPLFGTGGTFTAIINLLIFIVGAVSILMVIIGGLRYVLSGGDSAGVKSAKDTILYAIIGVIVAAIAYALVNFIVTKIG